MNFDKPGCHWFMRSTGDFHSEYQVWKFCSSVAALLRLQKSQVMLSKDILASKQGLEKPISQQANAGRVW
jgi:hypothetical protein